MNSISSHFQCLSSKNELLLPSLKLTQLTDSTAKPHINYGIAAN